jgi:hypothetical protein
VKYIGLRGYRRLIEGLTISIKATYVATPGHLTAFVTLYPAVALCFLLTLYCILSAEPLTESRY